MRSVVLMGIGLAFVVVASMIAASTASANVGTQLTNTFRLGTLYVATAERDMRTCSDTTTPCDVAVASLQTRSRIWLDAAGRVPISALSTYGRRVRFNLLEEFRFYYLAGDAFGHGLHDAYISDLRQAITQAVAAATRLDEQPWLQYVLTLADCSLGRLRLRIPGADPCA